MQLSVFLKSSLPQYVLAVIMSASMGFMLATCFYVSPDLQFDFPLLIGVSAGLSALLFAASYSRRTAVVGVVVALAALVGCVAYAQVVSQGAWMVDEESNPVPFFAELVATIMAVFLLSRRHWGTLVLFVGGAVLAALVQYLYHWFLYEPFVAYVAASLAMVFYRNYLDAFMSSSARQSAFGSAFGASVAICAAVVGLSAAAFYGVVAQLDPPTQEVKLVTRYMQLPTEDVHGIADYQYFVDPTLRSSNLTDEVVQSSTMGQSEVEEESNESPAGFAQLQAMAGSAAGFAVDSAHNFFDPVTYEDDGIMGFVLRILALLALILAPYAGKKLWRFYLARRMRSWTAERQVKWMYGYYLKKFDVLALGKPECDTPLEYAEAVGPYATAFERNASNTGIEDLSRTFSAVAYGAREATAEQLARFRDFHAKFYRNCLSYLGPVKYFMRFLRL